MKALYFDRHGGPEVLHYGDIPTPAPRPGEALVRVRAVALNHLDIWVRRGWRGLHLEFPHVGGSDIAGEIVSAPSDTGWKRGDRVVVYPGIALEEDEWTRRGRENMSPGYRILGEHLPGGLAEYIRVPAANLYPLNAPDFVTGAAPNLVATTCWRMLFGQGSLKAGEQVLVVGAGGGVNSLAIALATAAGASVIALAGSEEKARRAEQLGAVETIEYRQYPEWHREVLARTNGRGVDLVVDNVGQATMEKSLKAVTRGGRIVTVGNTSGHQLLVDNRIVFAKQISLIGSTMGNRQDFLDVLSFMQRHRITIPIDRVEPLSNGIAMLERLERGEHFGKIVLEP